MFFELGNELKRKTHTYACRYEPLFGYFQEFSDVAFRVVADNSVSDQSGTGVVHYAPQFGEDDFRVCLENGIVTKVCSG